MTTPLLTRERSAPGNGGTVYGKHARKPGRLKRPEFFAALTRPAQASGASPASVRPPRARRKRPLLRLLSATLLLAVVVVLVWGGGVAWAGYSSWRKIERVTWAPAAERPAAQPGKTYLLVGTDSRDGLNDGQMTEVAAWEVEGSRTDTIKLLHIGDGPATLLTIPRDSPVEIPGNGVDKINAAYAWGGPQLLVQTVESVTGIRIDGYMETGLAGVMQAVDAVDGITVCAPEDIWDDYTQLGMSKGCHEVDGVTALKFARTRYSLTFGDIARGMDQNQVIQQVAAKASTKSILLNPFKVAKVGDALSATFKLGAGEGLVDTAKMFLGLRQATSGDGFSCMMPLADMDVNWDNDRARALFELIRTDRTADITSNLCTDNGFLS